MISKTTGNIFDADAEALVNTVNIVGVMGKGIALQFKKAYPNNFKAYKKKCDAKELKPGQMFIFSTNTIYNPKYIINFPTKRHWRGKSKIKDIESGLKALVEEIKKLEIRSIAIPPLGCGNGGLAWAEVYPLIENALSVIPNLKVLVYEPTGSPDPKKMINKTERPRMTPGRAAVLGIMSRYAVPGYLYRLSLIEVQKLAYFLQEAGEQLKLSFVKDTYGPYADTMRHVLNKMEGHFTQGFGDGNNQPGTPIKLLPDAVKEAEEFLQTNSETLSRFDRVSELIEGFETPYGMEVLSSVHWVAKKENSGNANNVQSAINAVHGWNDRKRDLMKPEHIRVAWERLSKQGWI